MAACEKAGATLELFEQSHEPYFDAPSVELTRLVQKLRLVLTTQLTCPLGEHVFRLTREYESEKTKPMKRREFLLCIYKYFAISDTSEKTN